MSTRPFAREWQGLRLSLLWPSVAVLILFLDAVLLFADRPFHQRVFEGETGVIEMLTFFLLVAVVTMAAWMAYRTRGATRLFFAVVAVGCLFWGGEEISWGQSFLHWNTPVTWQAGNYQKETNLHNTRGAVGTLLNVLPRLGLKILTILCVLVRIAPGSWLAANLRKRFTNGWFEPFQACLLPAVLAIIASSLNKWRPLGYRDFGETEEMYVALFVLQFVVLKRRALLRE